jgi:hypothetical protein
MQTKWLIFVLNMNHIIAFPLLMGGPPELLAALFAA